MSPLPKFAVAAEVRNAGRDELGVTVAVIVIGDATTEDQTVKTVSKRVKPGQTADLGQILSLEAGSAGRKLLDEGTLNVAFSTKGE